MSNTNTSSSTLIEQGIKQQNTYNVIYSNGKASSIYIIASNIKEAAADAKKRQQEIGSAYYKLKRCYNGGVRG